MLNIKNSVKDELNSRFKISTACRRNNSVTHIQIDLALFAMIILPLTFFTCYQRRILIKLSCYLLKLRTENHKFIALIFRHRQSISMSLILYVLLMRIRNGYTMLKISDHFGVFFKLRSFVKCILNESIKKVGRY